MRCVALICALASSGAVFERPSSAPTGDYGTLVFRGEVHETVTLAINAHDMGDGVVAYAAVFSEHGREDPQTVHTEVWASVTDDTTFRVSERSLVAVRANASGLRSEEQLRLAVSR